MNVAAFVNVASHLPARARQHPYQLAVVAPKGRDAGRRVRYVHWTFPQLDAESDLLAWGLDAIGIRRGVRTVLMVKPSLEFFALTFALFKIGAVPVLVDPGMGLRNLGQCLKEAEPEAFIGTPLAHLFRLLRSWARPTVRRTVIVGRGLFRGDSYGDVREKGRLRGKGQSYDVPTVKPDETAAILFTSGSTGIPKGAVYTHGIFTAQVEMLRHTYGIEPGEIDLCTFPLFALFAPALGMTAIIPDMDATRPGKVNPLAIDEAMADWSVTNLFGSPALLRRLAYRAPSSGREVVPTPMPSLRRIISAGAPVPGDLLATLKSTLAPGVQVYTPYGATEALPVCNIGSDEILTETRQRTAEGAGVCIGRPVGVMSVKVIRITDDPVETWSAELILPVGQIGELVVKGPVVTRAYYNRPQQTALAKISDPVDGQLWHRMGDVGYCDERGRFWFCGRKSHRVVTRDDTLYTIPCEAIFNEHPWVFRTALVGVGSPGLARPVLCVELKEGVGTVDTIQLFRELRERGEIHPHTRTIQTFLVHPSFPVDVRHNAKIFREKLALWAARQLR
jgi:acyl-CoA synthetase (AMP-forming)/AMP-acid ligase II